MREFSKLYQIISYLRSENGCPWDKKQTLKTLRKYLIEEVYELSDAIEKDNIVEIIEETGDLILNILMIIVILTEQNRTDIKEVLNKIKQKIIVRHPHVFGDKKAKTAEEARLSWELHKKNVEGKRVFDSIPKTAPSLLKAYLLSKKADKVGFGFDKIEEVKNKIEEEMKELNDAVKSKIIEKIEHEIGDVLISLATLSLYLDVNPEIALQKGCNRFIKRFEYIENELEKNGKNIFEVSREEIEKLWEKSKLELNI